MKLFTVGYSGREPEELLEVLSLAGVRTVIDVRLEAEGPVGGDAIQEGEGTGKRFQRLLTLRGIGYRPLMALGNIFLECEDWRERYAAFVGRIGDLLSAKLQGLEGPLCLLGGEPRATDCHRFQIAEFLASRGHDIEHLDAELAPKGG